MASLYIFEIMVCFIILQANLWYFSLPISTMIFEYEMDYFSFIKYLTVLNLLATSFFII
jgi:hypothetical protein